MSRALSVVIAAAVLLSFGSAAGLSEESDDSSLTLPSNETIQMWIKKHEMMKKKPKASPRSTAPINPKDPKEFSITVPKGYGGICYIGPCYRPLNGYREVCYYDYDGWCQECWSEPDPVCY